MGCQHIYYLGGSGREMMVVKMMKINKQKIMWKRIHKNALEAVEKISDEEKKLIREIVETPPNSIMYLGYIPVHIRGVMPDEDP